MDRRIILEDGWEVLSEKMDRRNYLREEARGP
jgi:hypothetical protein